VRVELGPKDIAKGACVLARRDLPGKEAKEFGVPLPGAAKRIGELLQTMQTDLFNRAKKFRTENMHHVETYDEFKKVLQEKGGFIWAHWDGTTETANQIKNDTTATIRCIPFDRSKEAGKCIVTGKPSQGRVVFAMAY
jgi:prolyl-tRNA synthetase